MFIPSKEGILACCERLHMIDTGAQQSVDDDTVARDCRVWLRQRLEAWRARLDTNSDYDDAVKNLIAATLQQHDSGYTRARLQRTTKTE
jgi:hypothetical protein